MFKLHRFSHQVSQASCNRQTDRHTDKRSTVTLAAHARRGLMISNKMIILSTGPAILSTTPLVLVIVLALVKYLLWWVCYNCMHRFFRSPVFQPKCTPWLVTVYVAIANLVSTYFSDGLDWCFWLITRRQCWTYNIVTLSTDGGKDNHVTSAELFYRSSA